MAYTPEELIELTAIKVQEIVCPKIEHFMDGITKEVHQMHLEMRQNREFDSALIAQFNDIKDDIEVLKKMQQEVTELHTTLYKNGFVKRFEKLCDDFHDYIRSVPIQKRDTWYKIWGIRFAVIAALINGAGLLTKLIGWW